MSAAKFHTHTEQQAKLEIIIQEIFNFKTSGGNKISRCPECSIVIFNWLKIRHSIMRNVKFITANKIKWQNFHLVFHLLRLRQCSAILYGESYWRFCLSVGTYLTIEQCGNILYSGKNKVSNFLCFRVYVINLKMKAQFVNIIWGHRALRRKHTYRKPFSAVIAMILQVKEIEFCFYLC